MLAVGGHFSTLVCPQDFMIFEHLVRRVISPFRGSDRTSQCYETQIESLQKNTNRYETSIDSDLLCYETDIKALRNSNRIVTKQSKALRNSYTCGFVMLRNPYRNVTKLESNRYETNTFEADLCVIKLSLSIQKENPVFIRVTKFFRHRYKTS